MNNFIYIETANDLNEILSVTEMSLDVQNISNRKEYEKKNLHGVYF